ncbi:HlyD family secretion protein [uncultured Fusobacterium sp.]|jgi:membrane fusion protein (multidrug efflux system)|uniref:HlyD family secretion protein n=1 Tax=uncultured Fusobacterium sp. TaxID=159267 RepID=UPI0026600A6E|nr:HlyD family secretion protein [uncultured Fusobacterium sp.]
MEEIKNEEIKKNENIDEKNQIKNSNKKIALKKIFIFIICLVVIGIIFIFYWFLYGRTIEDTDDAYVNGSQNIITSQVSGTINKLMIEDTQYVNKGDLLATVDDIDYRLALENATASLGKAIRYYSSLNSQVAQLQKDVIAKENALKKAKTDYQIAKNSYEAGLASKHEFLTAKDNLNIAIASLEQSNSALDNAITQVSSTSIMTHPDVQQAITAYKKAYVDLERTKIYAPVSGIVAKKAIFLGQEVAPSQELLTIINLENTWADVNLKETQMKNVKVGNKVTLVSDVNKKKYSGYVQGISAGTGSSLSLLPAQNATGNWIKIVQRVPVRVHIDSDSIKENGIIPIGSSMKATVYLEKNSDKIVPFQEKTSSLYSIDEATIDEQINNIIKDNIQ